MFSARGYEAVSVRDIAGALGMSQAALYKHYANKRDIFDSILRRMEQGDAEKSQECIVPAENGGACTLDELKAFCREMFSYWTRDPFAASFRRLLTVEQYRSAEMSRLFAQYLGSGPLEYTAGLLERLGCAEPVAKAAELYSVMFMSMSLYDSAQDKEQLTQITQRHIDRFTI